MKEKYIINPDCYIEIVGCAGDNNFMVVVDDLFLDPETVVNFARDVAYFSPVGAEKGYYPGVRDEMPAPYGRALQGWVETHISKLYYEDKPILARPPICKLSLVTLRADELKAEQRIPHIDSTNENEYAFVHYLCDKRHGGTSLYRYKPTNQVKVISGQAELMSDAVRAVKANPTDYKGYLNSNTTLFERVAKVDAKFNRLVFYKSNLLHSANVNEVSVDNILNGRLSVASFMYFSEK